ncbi:cupredoxin domain-containing protein [Candidatus Woesearchaeota archaeon]|nr:cupredoxin domain-containing protein [Candidatus Woesearchaeota archaeon]
MEQKHIDEIDESFLGEEFIDEEDVSENNSTKSKKDKMKNTKKNNKKAVAKKVSSKNKAEFTEKPELKLSEEITIIPASESVFEEKKPEVSSTPVDPWKEETQETSFFKGVSTWKSITAIVIILLVISVFTQGFQFSETATELSISQAEEKALDYVNNNLLRPPFLAEVKKSEDTGNLYKITLGVAGEEVDSYLTKDGKIFFPQGFNTEESLSDSLETVDENNVEGVEEEEDVEVVEGTEQKLDEVQEEVQNAPETEQQAEEAEPVAEEVEPAVEEVMVEENTEASVENSVYLTVSAKKWLFSPNELVVQKGDVVELTVKPAFDFTFAIPALEVEQEVVGETKISFTAEQSGTFEFTCSSCEGWRGMLGTLVVK